MATTVGTPAISLNEAIVRVRGADGRVLGCGFLVGAREILTCAHVVAQAHGEPDDQQPVTDAEVFLDFPLVAPGQILTARVVVWRSAQADATGDIAGLELSSTPPSGARPIRLMTADDLWAHPCRTFGFPARHDDGVWASGRLLGRQATGWVQLEDVKTTGFRVERGFSGAPVWDDELHGVVGMAVAAEAQPEVRGAYLTPTDVLVAAWPKLQAQAVPPCPYRGLFAFREQDAALFFGREELTSRLVDQITRRSVIAVVGPSGSGKSSLAFAGAIPQLRQREGWAVASLRPSREASPLNSLAAALLPLLEPDMTESDRLGELPKLAGVLADGRLAEVADRALERAGARRVLLVIDQFEELYAQTPTDARQFVDVLVEAAVVQRQRISPAFTFVVTLRADFLGQALEHAGLAQALQGSVLVIGRMSREQLRRAIEGPVGREVTFEVGLVDRILDDVGAEPGNLPLLQFALTLLWERQVRRTLTHAAYETLGAVEGALARYAEQVYLDELPEQERVAARRVFIQLIRPGEATEPTRQVAHRADLDEVRWRVAQRLAATRLVVTGRDAAGMETVEVVHEALISGWERLRQWVEEDREFRTWQERLRAAVGQWERSNLDEGALLRGAPLVEAERWLEQRQADVSLKEQEYIHKSQGLRAQEVKQAAQRKRATRRLRLVIAMLATLTLLATASIVATQQVRTRQLEVTRSQLKAAEAEANLNAIINGRELANRSGLNASSVSYSPDGRLVALGRDNGIEVWNPERGLRVAVLLQTTTEPVRNLTFSPDGHTLAGASGDSVALWDIDRRAPKGEIPIPDGPVDGLAYSPDGRVLILNTEGGSTYQVDTSTLAVRRLR